jgi:PAS domain S-box-containing protein
MKRNLAIAAVLVLALYYSGAFAEFVLLFKDEKGHTNWQYLANWSSATLIMLLSVTASFLYFSRQRANKANIELESIKNKLEILVQQRTATLDESNRLLIDTSSKLLSSEQYLKSILTSMPFMLVGLDSDGTITQWNIKAEEFTAISAEDAMGNNLWDVYPSMIISADQVAEVIKSQKITSIRQGHSGLRHYDITLYPLESAEKPGIALLIHDVSKQVKFENRIIQHDRMSSMGELASSTANDISGPLQNIMIDIKRINGDVNLLSEQTPTDFSKQFTILQNDLNDAVEQGNQVSAIIDNLLDFASAQLDSKQQVNMVDVMDHALELSNRILTVPQRLEFKQVKIERKYDSNLPMVSCHVAEIQQVYLNLLRHCLHALAKVDTEDFVPKITVRIQECYNALWVKITHNGKGLTGDEQHSIFEPYFSNEPLDGADDADKRLSFCHFIVTEHHNGEMAVTSAADVGTTFHMEF